jgi:tetratricopeptide (TPR) repeat protein
VNEYADAIKEVKSALEQSKINNNNWLETLDTPIETDGVSYLRDCIQDYFAQFLETDNLPFAEKLADVCVELYPKEAIFLTDKGTARYYAGDQQGAAEWYLKAHKNSPNDMLIATNLAILYEQQGEIKKAIKYYTIVAKSGDEEFSESAKAALTELKAE